MFKNLQIQPIPAEHLHDTKNFLYNAKEIIFLGISPTMLKHESLVWEYLHNLAIKEK